MHNLQNLPYRSKEQDRYDASDSASFLSSQQERVDHNADQPQSSAIPSSPPTDSAEATTRFPPPPPDGGVPIDEEALAMFPDYHHVVLSSDDDSSDGCSSDESSFDEGSYDNHSPRGTLIEPTQVIEPLQRRKGHPRPQIPRQSGPDHRHKPNDDQEAVLSYATPLPVFNHQRDKFVVESDSSMLVCQPSRGLQSAQPLPTVTLNPRVGMAVEGGRLYLAQTLHHYYRKHIHCPRHGPIDGRPGHHRTVRKVHETGQVYRVWYCTSQPKWEGHRIDNTAYIELAKVQLDQALFDRVLHELIRQLRSRDCQPVARNRSPQPDDFDHLALLSYVGSYGAPQEEISRSSDLHGTNSMMHR